MKYLARVNNQGFQVAVEDDGRVVVGDRAFSVDLKSIDEGALFSLLIDHESYELVVDEGQDSYRLLLWGETYEVTIENAQSRQVEMRRSLLPVPSGGECIVRAPMPGLVVQVPVSAGQEVSAGQVLVVLESMKMENELLAPRPGVVKAIHVAAGDTPRLDEPLVTLM